MKRRIILLIICTHSALNAQIELPKEPIGIRILSDSLDFFSGGDSAKYKDTLFTGIAYSFENGRLLGEYYYSDGILDGSYRIFRNDGSLKYEVNFNRGKQIGPEKFWGEYGQLYVDGYLSEMPNVPEDDKLQMQSKALSNRLRGGFTNSTNPRTGSGQGNTTQSGDQGKPTGDLQGNSMGNGGTDNSGDYQLGSRKALGRPKPLYDCEGEGVVVVRIWVDRVGVVQRVEGGVSGSTASQSCLVRRAEEAARKTRWEGDPAATDLQIGTIRYRFSRQ